MQLPPPPSRASVAAKRLGDHIGQINTCIFDAYGTLFDVNAAARAVAEMPGQAGFAAIWQQVAADWRAKQLQYTWLRTLTGGALRFLAGHARWA